MAKIACRPCFAPLILRICLGLIFIWAGLGKLMDTFPVKGQDAADLANMGVNMAAATPVAPAAPSPKPTTTGPDTSSPTKAAHPEPSLPLPDKSVKPAPTSHSER